MFTSTALLTLALSCATLQATARPGNVARLPSRAIHHAAAHPGGHSSTTSNSTEEVETHELLKRDYTGMATYYDTQTGNQGSCGGYLSNSDWTVAMTSNIMNDGLCGKQIAITAYGQTHVGTIRDTCPSCVGYSGIDLSPSLFAAFASFDVGTFECSWAFTDGSGSSQPTTSQYVAPTTSSVWVAPTTSSTWVAPTTSSTPAWTPSSSSSEYTPPSSTYVAPTTSSSAAPTSTSSYIAPITVSSSAATISASASGNATMSVSGYTRNSTAVYTASLSDAIILSTATSVPGSTSTGTPGTTNTDGETVGNLQLLSQALVQFGHMIVVQGASS